MKIFFIYLTINVVSIFSHEAKDFDDTILYRVSWLGNSDLDESKFESITVTTHDKEQYECKIPMYQEKKVSTTMNDARLALGVIEQFFSLTSCSYRIESYWTYEVCHGHHVKQYHEEREGKQVKLQEYYLGKWNSQKMEKLKKELDENIKAGIKLKTVKIDNVLHPYLEMEMTDGSYCALNNEPRVTKLRYVCHPHGKNELYSIKETSSCNYEAIILTTILCLHESLKPDDATDSIIKCSRLNNAPEIPLSWLKNEFNRLKAAKAYGELEIILNNGMVDEKITNVVLPREVDETPVPKQSSGETSTKKSINSKIFDDQNVISEFLTGKKCLTGGTAWWKYEFCYGKSVRQYHVDKNGETSLILGYFDEVLHRYWINVNPDKRPKPLSVRSEVSHLYQGGTICDKTGNKRLTEVKLRCLPTETSLVNVMMYLLEPTTCQYILVVESPIICSILPIVDEFGLVPLDAVVADDTKEPKAAISSSSPVDIEVLLEND